MKKISGYWGVYLVVPFFLAGIAGFFLFHKGDAELMLNHHTSTFGDFFFKNMTWLGNGIVFAVLVIFFLFYRYYFTIVTVVVILVQTLIVQVLKLVVFPHADRPIIFFSHVPGMHYVEGVKMDYHHSFPSGHSATAFSVTTLIILLFRNKKYSALWFGLAILVALSRVYLLQHFFMDIFSGAAIGIISAYASWYFLARTRWAENESLKKSLGTLFMKH